MNRSLISVRILCLIALVSGRHIPEGAKRTPRQDLIGGWIQNSQWFPIEINVPDTISSVGQGLSNFGQGIQNGWMTVSDGFGNWIQQIPIVNRITSHFIPRPVKYYMMMPISKRVSTGFNPFKGSVSNYAPFYP